MPRRLQSWGWRIPFLLGLVVGLAGVFLRRGSARAAARRQATRSPLVEGVPTIGPAAAAGGPSVFNSVGFYVMFVYLVSWLQLVDGVAPARRSASTPSA